MEDATNYKITGMDGVVHTFNRTSGFLTSVRDRSGRGYNLNRNGTLPLTQTLTDGRSITWTHTATSRTATLPNNQTVQYGLTSGRLTSVTFPGKNPIVYRYSAGGLLDKVTDANGNVVAENIYTNGRVTSQKDGHNQVSTFAWNAATQTSVYTDQEGNNWTEIYRNNVLVRSITPTGATTTYSYDHNLNVSTVEDPLGRTTSYSYDTNSRLVDTLDSGGGRTQRTYTSDGLPANATDAQGRVTSFTYDGSRNLIRIDYPGGGSETLTYTNPASGLPSSSTGPRGGVTSYLYQSYGLPSKITTTDGGATQIFYNSLGQATSSISPQGSATPAVAADYTTLYTYNLKGQVLTYTNRDGKITTWTYDGAGDVLSTTNAKNETTTHTYGPNHRHLTTTLPDLSTIQYGYDKVGRRISTTDQRGKVGTQEFDDDGRVVSATTPEGRKSKRLLDPSGALYAVVPPQGNVTGANPAEHATTYTYDTAGRPKTVTNPLGAKTTFVYAPDGRTQSVTDARGHITTYTYDTAGRVATVVAPDQTATTYGYDLSGNLTTRTDANNHTTTWTYDLMGRLLTETDPLGKISTLTYNLEGGVATATSPNGNNTSLVGDGTVAFSYDNQNQLILENYSQDTDLAFTYDDLGRTLSIQDPQQASSQVTYTYDNRGQTRNITTPQGSFNYTYDAAGLLTSKSWPGNNSAAYTYTDDGLLASTTQGAAATTYSYDANGASASTSLPDGTVQELAYDKAGQTSATTSKRNGTSFFTETWTRDLSGNPLTSTGSNGNRTYEHDNRNRLTKVCYAASCTASVDFEAWTYDAVGNRIEERTPGVITDFYHDAADQLVSSDEVGPDVYLRTFTYDANGQLLTDTGGRKGRTFTWNQKGQTTSVAIDADLHAYTYNVLGHRTQLTTPLGNREHVWDPSMYNEQLLVEKTGGVTSKTFRAGAGTEGYTDASSQYYHSDLAGSHNATTQSGTTTPARGSYTPFGERKTSDLSFDTTLGFTGELQDSTGLTHLRARLYDPELGRFLARDIQDTPTGSPYVSRYAYVNNQPLQFADPSGEKCEPSARPSTSEGALGALLMFGYYVNQNCNWINPVFVAPTNVLADLALGGGMNQLSLYGGEALYAVPQTSALYDAGVELTGFISPGGKGKVVADIAQEGSEAGARKTANIAAAACPISSKPNSFTGDTLVTLADGTKKTIKDIEVGDLVLAEDPLTGRQGAKAVTDLRSETATKDIVTLTLSDGTALKTTRRHPFWNDATQRWMYAENAVVGDLLRADDGTQVRVVSVRVDTVPQQSVYNFTVEDYHTYFVGEGVLVHNEKKIEPCTDDIPGITGKGPYAGPGTPASKTNQRRYTEDEKTAVQREGEEFGCHRCGTKEPNTPTGNYIRDHVPAISQNPDGKDQVLYPHCWACSLEQAKHMNSHVKRIK